MKSQPKPCILKFKKRLFQLIKLIPDRSFHCNDLEIIRNNAFVVCWRTLKCVVKFKDLYHILPCSIKFYIYNMTKTLVTLYDSTRAARQYFHIVRTFGNTCKCTAQSSTQLMQYAIYIHRWGINQPKLS